MNFLRNFLASLLALVVFTLVIFVFFSMMISAIGAKDAVEVEANSVLHLHIDRPIEEYEFEDPMAELGLAPKAIGLVQLKQSLDNAKDDEKIKGVFLEIPMLFTAGFSTIEEIRNYLQEFKESGKFVIAYSQNYSEAAYYLATIADSVYLHPEGDLEFNGLSADVVFFKGLLEKLNIEPQVFRVGTFKSAVEPFIRTDMSEENEEQMKFLLEGVYTNMLARISEQRNIPVAELRNISDQMLVRSPQEALNKKLVDNLYYRDEINERIREKLELEENSEINFITHSKYKKSYSTFKSSDNELAVIVANGNIVEGEGDNYSIGGEKFAKEIRKARLDEGIKAIVLRINSPGGSFLASDVMWREIMLAAEEKTVIASMSDLAASGGYYMAMACDTIVAMPNTITGSIGIFGIVPDMSGFFNEKLGITFDVVKTGEISDLYTVIRPLTEREKQIIQNDVEAGYETFISKAARGRGMTVEQVKEVASGRVWTGEQALERNLVDVMGDLNTAVGIAAESAGIADDYKVRYYPKPKTFIEQLFQDMETNAKEAVLKQELGIYYDQYKHVKYVKDQRGLMSRMDFDFYIY
ncbi:MAG: signal peptide peptidase SppA [Candidatus Cyclobacteriaceae bacterium M2_1C_046]